MPFFFHFLFFSPACREQSSETNLPGLVEFFLGSLFIERKEARERAKTRGKFSYDCFACESHVGLAVVISPGYSARMKGEIPPVPPPSVHRCALSLTPTHNICTCIRPSSSDLPAVDGWPYSSSQIITTLQCPSYYRQKLTCYQ